MKTLYDYSRGSRSSMLIDSSHYQTCLTTTSRPKTLADVTSQDHTTLLLQRTLHAPNLPHLLFYGPPGTGKTSTVLALSKQLFGPLLFRTRVLELNASDERGISIVRTKIKDFAKQQLSGLPPGAEGEEYKKKYPCPPFKIVVLDEADSMTQDAQSALRRTMETYSRITRFCLICNYVTRIIDPLASRCSKFRFKSLESGDAKRRIEEIAEKEGVRMEDGASEVLVKCAEGDLRRAITYLQSAARLVGAVAGVGAGPVAKRGKKRKVAEDDEGDADAMDVDSNTTAQPTTQLPPITIRIIEEIAGVIPTTVIDRLLTGILPPSTKTTSTPYDLIASAVTDLIADGWSATQLLGQLYTALVFDETHDVPDKAKNKVLGVFSEADRRLSDGADEQLVVLDLCLRAQGAIVETVV